jgi:hypothetical protein
MGSPYISHMRCRKSIGIGPHEGKMLRVRRRVDVKLILKGTLTTTINVKQSRYRPGVAQRVPGS